MCIQRNFRFSNQQSWCSHTRLVWEIFPRVQIPFCWANVKQEVLLDTYISCFIQTIMDDMFFRPTLFLEIARSSGMIQTSKSTLLWPLIPINPEKQNQNQFKYQNSQKRHGTHQRFLYISGLFSSNLAMFSGFQWILVFFCHPIFLGEGYPQLFP